MEQVPFDKRSTIPPVAGTGICEPPPTENRSNVVINECCVGSISAGGKNQWNPGMGPCALTMEAVHSTKYAAMELMNNGSLQLFEREDQPIEMCDVCRIIDIAMEHNYTIAFTGDSIQRQLFGGFLCEIARNGFQVIVKGLENHPVAPDTYWGHGVRASRLLEVKRNNDNERQGIKLRFYRQYRPLPNNISQIREISEWSDILIFNFGVHYLPEHRDEYIEQMNELYAELRQHDFAFLGNRETAAQHNDNIGGEFDYNKKWPLADCVDEIPLDDRLFGWREILTKDIAEKYGYNVLTSDSSLFERSMNQTQIHRSKNSTLFTIPFLNYTRRLGHIHKRKMNNNTEEYLDCTHFCTSPFLWMPLWRSIRLGLEYQMARDDLSE
jgi:hypothetical protein